MNKANMIWFSGLLTCGFTLILVGFALWYPLLFVEGPLYAQMEYNRFFGPGLFGAGFFLMAIAWFVASSKSGRVLGVCVVLGIVSLFFSTILAMASVIGRGFYDLVIWAAFDLIFGSLLAFIYRRSNNSTISERS